MACLYVLEILNRLTLLTPVSSRRLLEQFPIEVFYIIMIICKLLFIFLHKFIYFHLFLYKLLYIYLYIHLFIHKFFFLYNMSFTCLLFPKHNSSSVAYSEETPVVPYTLHTPLMPILLLLVAYGQGLEYFSCKSHLFCQQ